MSTPQLTDPGISSEWFPTVEEVSRSNAAARRQRFTRLVSYTMVGLTAFAVLGLGCFAWRQHTLQAALEAPPPSAQATLLPGVPGASLANPAAPPVSDPLVLVPAPPPVAAPSPVAKLAPKPSKKQPTRSSPFLKNSKPQPATIKRR